jgi:hypothetical protein
LRQAAGSKGKSGAALNSKSFLVLFFKKELLPSACLPFSVGGSERWLI